MVLQPWREVVLQPCPHQLRVAGGGIFYYLPSVPSFTGVNRLGRVKLGVLKWSFFVCQFVCQFVCHFPTKFAYFLGFLTALSYTRLVDKLVDMKTAITLLVSKNLVILEKTGENALF